MLVIVGKLIRTKDAELADPAEAKAQTQLKAINNRYIDYNDCLVETSIGNFINDYVLRFYTLITKKVLTTLDLTSLGVGSCVGTGMYLVAGMVAHKVAGPSVVMSFIVAAVASLFSGITGQSSWLPNKPDSFRSICHS
ncbi:hypothetical protein TNCT_329391 [Trichonephila clavata]|uniref:Uncharacterized protein n=1 Tax=Trichonephila clavata TaxID=2740835 RepID=A0A8X6HEQ9_TRICU|nr:hypothetical protein TNCT_329391 [Trichonephila clavata]